MGVGVQKRWENRLPQENLPHQEIHSRQQNRSRQGNQPRQENLPRQDNCPDQEVDLASIQAETISNSSSNQTVCPVGLTTGVKEYPIAPTFTLWRISPTFKGGGQS